MLYTAKAFFFQKSSLLKKNICSSQLLYIVYLLLMIICYPKSMISYLIGFTIFMTGVSMEVKKYNDKRKSLQHGEKNR